MQTTVLPSTELHLFCVEMVREHTLNQKTFIQNNRYHDGTRKFLFHGRTLRPQLDDNLCGYLKLRSLQLSYMSGYTCLFEVWDISLV